MKSPISMFNKNGSTLWNSLPGYIKGFSVYFFLLGLFVCLYIPGQVFQFLPSMKSVSIYGLRATSFIHGIGFIILILYLYKVFVGYSFYVGKSYAFLLGFIDANLGLLICGFIALEPVFLSDLVVPHVVSFEILLLIPYSFYMSKRLFSHNENVV